MTAKMTYLFFLIQSKLTNKLTFKSSTFLIQKIKNITIKEKQRKEENKKKAIQTYSNEALRTSSKQHSRLKILFYPDNIETLTGQIMETFRVGRGKKMESILTLSDFT